MKTTLKTEKYPSLNGLRAISILLVIMMHMQMHYYITFNKCGHWLQLLLKSVYYFMCDNGQLGVNIFFVISGFLITSLMLNEEKKTGTVFLKGFYTRRILRILPAYYFLLLAYFILQIFGIIHLSHTSWLVSLTYTRGFFAKEEGAYIGHFWSLSVEEFFYLFWPMVFLLGVKTRKKAAWLIFFIVPVIRLCTLFHPISWINHLTLYERIDAIATGCLVALYKDKILKLPPPHTYNCYCKIVFGVSVISLVFLRYLPLLNIIKPHPHLSSFISTELSCGTTANIAVAVILLYSVFQARGIWFKFLNSKILNYIGILSYSLYLWHVIFIMGLNKNEYWVARFPQNLVCAFAAALFSHYVIEKPFLKLKERFKR